MEASKSIDDLFAAVAAAVPQFGGLLIENGSPTILVTDLTAGERAADAASGVFPAVAARRAAVVFRQVQYSFSDLAAWKARLYAGEIPRGVVLVDIDERLNKLRIEFDSSDRIPAATSALAARDIPLNGLHLARATQLRSAQGGSIQGIVDPRMGGVQIGGPSACTLGFNVKRPGDNQKYFVTNAHCTGQIGVVTGAQFGQPLLALPIGVEYLDPPYRAPSLVPGCPVTLTVGCRFADAALVRYNSGVGVNLYRLAQTTFHYAGSDPSASGSFVMASNPLIITGEMSNAQLSWGENVNKIGMASGWTWGFVVGSCVDEIFLPTVARLCQYDAVATARPGDSGSPVFRYDTGIPGTGTLAWLIGILHGAGVNFDGASYFRFSPISGVQKDLGPLITTSPLF